VILPFEELLPEGNEGGICGHPLLDAILQGFQRRDRIQWIFESSRSGFFPEAERGGYDFFSMLKACSSQERLPNSPAYSLGEHHFFRAHCVDGQALPVRVRTTDGDICKVPGLRSFGRLRHGNSETAIRGVPRSSSTVFPPVTAGCPEVLYRPCELDRWGKVVPELIQKRSP
jgi:hypothetical protein